MIKCQNCGASVTQQYARVFCPEGVDQPRCCPKCPDMTREAGGEVREKRT